MMLKKLPLALLAMGGAMSAYAADFRIGEFRIEGEQHTSEATVRSLLPVQEGDMYSDEIGEDIIRQLHASGFYENVLLEQNDNMLIITVKERPIISDVTIKGAKTLQNDAILKTMSTMRGRSADDDSDLILNKKSDSDKSYEEKLADLDKTGDETVQDALSSTGLGKGDFFSNDALIRGLRSLDSAYKEQGKNDVKITPEVQNLANNRVAITITIDEGTTTRVSTIDFVGNEHFSDWTLARQIGLTDGTLFSWLTKSNVFSWEKARQDKKRLEAFYHRKGFYDFTMDLEDVERQLNEDKKRETITIKINEGQRYRWGGFDVVGDHKEVPKEKLMKHLSKLKRGKISNHADLQAAMAAIKLDLQEAGYAYADVQAAPQREGDVLNVNVNVSTGPRISVRQINITGNNKTRDEVLRREFRQMEAAAYDQKKINRSAQRLRQLGYFEDVNVKNTPVEQDEHQVDVDVKVKERNTGSLNASVGWSQDDGMVLAGSVAQDNLFGTGKSGSLSVSRSKVRQQGSLSFTDPYFTPDGVSMSYSLFGSNYNPYKQNNSPRSYKIARYGGQAVMGIPITEYDRVNVGLGVEHIKVGLFSQSPARYRRYVDEYGESNWLYKGILSWYRNTTDDAYWYQRAVTALALMRKAHYLEVAWNIIN
nr:outer membrane protein assembly factor BamA [Alysiella crassa]